MELTIEQALQRAVEDHKAGKLQDAEALYRAILQTQPNHPDANHNLGVMAVSLNKTETALPHFKIALEANPNQGQFWLSYVDALIKEKQFDNARNVLEQGKMQGLTGENVDVLEAQLKSPAQIEINNLLEYYQKGQHDLVQNLATTLTQQYPNHPFGWKVLGALFSQTGKLQDSVIANQKALEISPNDAEAHSNLGNTLQELGRLEDAKTSYHKAIALKPDYVEAHSNFIFYSSHNDLIDAKELYARHCRFGQLFEAPLRSHWPQHLNSREPERCLKIGFVSADLREHSMATFIGPLLELWARYPNLSLYAYYNLSTNDRTTEQLKRHFAHWQVVVGLPDAALADKISADGIDILFDLSGHTAKHRLLTFARKPAPIQVSWMGYPGTTGLMAMDYYFNDRFHLRQGGLNAQFTEKIVYLPASAPFQQIYKAPPVNTLPSLKNGYVTFGSFNRSNKLSRPVVTLWSQLLRALPSSRMLLGGMPKVRDFDWLIDWFAQEGISSERLSFYRLCDAEVYLDLHHEVDICLDTFPYGGGTTTCHALWMGVPTLTLAGQTLPSRVSACLQSHAGLADFACHHEAEFIEKGLYWSNHLAELAIIRAGLRERFENSAMGQASVIAASVERALRIMWQRWCAGLPAESFEVSTINTGNRQAEGSQ